MLTEECVSCGADVPLSAAVHMLVNPKEGEEVADGYLCRSCYEEHVQPILPDEEQDLVEDADDGPGDPTPPDAGDRPDDVDPTGDDATDEPDAGDEPAPGEA